jgi:putative transposase
MTSARSEMSHLYRKESDPKVKERLLLILRVKGDSVIPARAAKELHKSRTWASEWLARYDNDGVDGLKDKPKTGRPTKLSEEISLKIRKILIESKQGWTTKQVEDMIVREGDVKYHYTHVYRLLHKWGFKLKVPRKVHINTTSKEEKEAFKKEHRKY